MHGGSSSPLCVRTKTRQISVRGEWYVNCSQMAQHRFAVRSTHMRIWFVIICEQFTNHLVRLCIRGFRLQTCIAGIKMTLTPLALNPAPTSEEV